VRQGDDGDDFYMLFDVPSCLFVKLRRQGSARVLRRPFLGADEREVGICRAGDFFGERALVRNEVELLKTGLIVF
jgi:CRP-like cAMP-binding protein